MKSKNHHWLVHVDRQCWPLWLQSLGAAGPVITPEIGENVRSLTFPEALQPERLTASGLTRFVIPVAFHFTHTDLLTRRAEIETTLQNLSRRSGANGASLFAIRRHGRFALASLANWATKHFDQTTEPLPSEPRLMIAFSDAGGYAGVISQHQAGATYPSCVPPPWQQSGPSRARGKLVEAFAWLSTLGLDADAKQVWLELGAFPGGMTSELAARGHEVFAVDAHPPSAAINALPGVTYAVGDARTITVGERVFDAILCDMNGSPVDAARAVAHFTKNLKPNGLIVHTLKLPRWHDFESIHRAVQTIFELAGIKVIGIRHLWHNRQEVTLLARRQ